MTRLLSLIAVLVMASDALSAQTCVHAGLSEQFRLKIKLERYDAGDGCDSCSVTVTATSRLSGRRQMFSFSAGCLYHDAFRSCAASRSYQTGLRQHDSVTDNDYGDVIVADFNFDGRDDFAVKRDSGGNGGPVYNFYLQRRDSTFIRDRTLSDQMQFFPRIHDSAGMLVTYVHANVSQQARTEYIYNAEKGTWRRGKRTYVDY